eukprot:CAMPEP_0182869836 /NCGR_PEP_ID=MMETSP0034_2-20130328/10168_1 /TAXON_ID=156128 /ORGANISM="Nephroselmis pyriformis, Strain CCMP717" /LENGTH=114 /DNA_ID=CAMNT_0025002315 /DNA_START=25 /DNA_END=366 /DNA_ORIENTATION=-
MGTEEERVDTSELCFRADEFLAQFPGGFLSRDTVIDYIRISPFWGAENGGELPPGVEYVVAHAQDPHIYVIRKQLRVSADNAKHMTFYYVLDGSIYQAPTLHGVIAARANRCLH